MRRMLPMFGAVVAVLVLAVGCAPSRGDPAIWELVDPGTVSTTSTSLSIGVTRLGCSSGVTGQPLKPRVTYEDQRVVIVAEVEPHIDGGRCPGNPSVPVVLKLPEPVGDRDLVDGACLGDGPAVRTSSCTDPIRWAGRGGSVGG